MRQAHHPDSGSRCTGPEALGQFPLPARGVRSQGWAALGGRKRLWVSVGLCGVPRAAQSCNPVRDHDGERKSEVSQSWEHSTSQLGTAGACSSSAASSCQTTLSPAQYSPGRASPVTLSGSQHEKKQGGLGAARPAGGKEADRVSPIPSPCPPSPALWRGQPTAAPPSSCGGMLAAEPP